MTDDRASAAMHDGMERVLPRFEDKLMGIPIVLLNSAIESEVDGEVGVTVPDSEGLRAAVAVARVTIPDKLGGSEIRALRRALGMQARTLAEFLDVTPETFSRWENGKEAISRNAERLLRLRVFQSLRNQAQGVRAKSEDILDIKLAPLRLANKPLLLAFQRVPGGVWWFCGLDEGETAVRMRA